MTGSCKDAALELIEWGFSVIPIKAGSKKPLISWAEFQERQPSEDEVEHWFSRWPKAQLALVTGQVSKVAVIDLDGPKGKQWAKDNLKEWPTVWQQTTKGAHLLYRANGIPIPNGVGIAEQVDIRGEGGYILIEPSVHPQSGKPYKLKFRPGATWEDLTDFPVDKIPYSERIDKDPVTLNPVGIGERNDTLAQIAGKYIAKGLDFQEVLTLCKGWNLDCEEPQSNSDVLKTVRSIWKKHQKEHPYEQESADVSSCQHQSADGSICQPDVSEVQAQGSQPTPNSLHQAVEMWILNNSGIFTTSQIDNEFNLRTRIEKNNRSRVLNRLASQGFIRKEGQRTGTWRIVAKDSEAMDIFGTGAEKLQIPLCMGISGMVNLYPGSIVVVAGTSNSGKSALVTNLAFSLFADVSTLREIYNIYSIPAYVSKQGRKPPQTYVEYLSQFISPSQQEAEVHYFNSEMASPELRDRLDAFPGGVESFRKINFWKRTGDFADAIRPNGINIIDFLECYDEFWKIGQWINEIHKELNRGIAIVVLQKKTGASTGRGGELTMEKPRLYINLENNAPHGGICKIVKAKSFVDPQDNPNGKEIDFKLIDGWKFQPISSWRHVSEKDREKINRQYKRQKGNEYTYAFEFRTEEGEIKGLNFKDLEKWKEAYTNIDVEHELDKISKDTMRRDFLTSKNWFHKISKILEKKNNDI